ncbi:sulfatase-like hydrolase/transferase [Halomontanus rarus]|uniref:sulfatase-like hydrolase/transferase n=1 Tax=Halomontanus rarus TaxID=3034020 RepID=UPI0023E848B0|nr:sulfatase-like hydrolase/transferase [Halovivax sp. TS33]
MPDRPNLLFVFADQLGARWTGCGGSHVVQTPRLDALADEGVYCERAYSNSPVCTPYRGMLLTGRYPSQTGIRWNGTALPDDVPTIAEAFRASGYHPCWIGKWHISGAPHEERWIPPDQRGGFRDFVGWESHHVDHMDGRVWEDDPDDSIELAGHETDGLTEIAVKRLRSLAGTTDRRPFAAFVSYQAPHPPCTALPEYASPYEDRDLIDEPTADPDAVYDTWDEKLDLQEFRKRYYTEITHLDNSIGCLLDLLEEEGLAEDTIVVVTSDHGEMNGCHGLFDKGRFYEESIRVPLAVRGPGIDNGRRIEAPVSAIDLFPTLCDLCDVDSVESVSGSSFAAELAGCEAVDSERPHFFEHDDWIGIVRGSRKLLADRADCSPRAYYDLDVDSWERTDLLSSTDEAAIEPLHEQLQEWHESVVAPTME